MAAGKDYAEFSKDLKAFAEKIDVDFELALKKIVFECWNRIIARSPVDSGTFRNSWTLNEGVPLEDVKPKGSYPDAPSTPSLELKSPFTIIWINNSLPYAARLENGWSQQAPTGMVSVTSEEMATYIASILGKT